MSIENNRIEYLEHEINKYGKRLYIHLGLIILWIIAGLFLIISYWVHWFSNDSLTTMQIFKWQISKYWWIFVFIVAEYINYRWIFQDDIHYYKSFKKQLEKEQKND